MVRHALLLTMALTLIAAVGLGLPSCSDDAKSSGSGDGGGGGAGGAGGEGEGEGSPVVPARPEAHATLTVAVDDSAAQTYRDGDLRWNGSFIWEEASNVVTHSSAWEPTDGPFPVLRDDGPISTGGHEPEGAVADDNLHSAAVWVDTTGGEDLVFEYGVINDRDNWIWVGRNGVVTVPAGSTDELSGPGLTIPGFGKRDLKLTLDMANLDQEANAASLEGEPKVYLKGTPTNWGNVLLFDDGEKGDDEGGDGIYTYVQSERLGPHVGLLQTGEPAAQFVWVHLFEEEGDPKVEGLEYKVQASELPEGVSLFDTPDPERASFLYATPEGVKAWSRPVGGDWVAEEVGLGLESRGVAWNTAVILSNDDPGSTEGEGEEGEGEGEEGGPEVLLVDPATGPAAGGNTVAVHGTGFAEGATVTFGGVVATEVDVSSTEALTCVTPAHAAGMVDVAVTVDGKTGTFRGGFTYSEGPGLPVPFVDGDLSDWEDDWWRGTNETASNWDPGLNSLDAIGVMTDGASLYIAIRGKVEAANAIIGYVDIDAGAGTGATSMAGLTDDDGALDATLSNPIEVSTEGFGAELGFGTVGMASTDGLVGNAGWRGLAPLDNFDWLGGDVIANGARGVVEARIALPQGTGARISVFARITNAAGDAFPNQSLPSDNAEAPASVGAVVEVAVP